MGGLRRSGCARIHRTARSTVSTGMSARASGTCGPKVSESECIESVRSDDGRPIFIDPSLRTPKDDDGGVRSWATEERPN
jgi:hypothetical protein